MSVQRLANTIKNIIDTRIQQESRALHGKIVDGRFLCGNKSYPYESAVDVNTLNGKTVWAQLSQNNSAVIIGE